MNEAGFIGHGTGYERVAYWSAVISGKPSIGFAPTRQRSGRLL